MISFSKRTAFFENYEKKCKDQNSDIFPKYTPEIKSNSKLICGLIEVRFVKPIK